jgi:ABC-2 type transport system ATP-binding protein
MNYIVNIKHITKKYRDTVALNDVSLNLERGKVYGLIGENGSGKTTLIKAILGFIHYSGDITVENMDSNVPVSYVPEVINFYDYLTGIESIKLITKLQGKDIDEMLYLFRKNALEIDYFDEQKLIKQHSKGNLRKLLLLQSFSIHSDLMLLDEPFSGLDPIVTEKIKPFFIRKKEENTTILLSTHLFDVAKTICDELIFIKKGIVLCQIGKDSFSQINLIELFNDKQNI